MKDLFNSSVVLSASGPELHELHMIQSLLLSPCV